MGKKRSSWNADIKAYSERALERGRSEKLPMQPRRLYSWEREDILFQVTKRGLSVICLPEEAGRRLTPAGVSEDLLEFMDEIGVEESVSAGVREVEDTFEEVDGVDGVDEEDTDVLDASR